MNYKGIQSGYSLDHSLLESCMTDHRNATLEVAVGEQGAGTGALGHIKHYYSFKFIN